jgi:hypothetical protein
MKRQLFGVFVCLAAHLCFAQNTFHGNNARTGVFDSAGPKQAPTVKWTFKAAGPVSTTPAVVDGVVYIASLSGHM